MAIYVVYTLWESAVGAPDGALWWQIGPQKPLLVAKGDFGWGDPAQTKRFYGFNSRLVLPLLGSYQEMVVVAA